MFFRALTGLIVKRDWEKTPSQIKKPNDELILDSSFGFLYTQKIVPDMM